MKVLFDPIYTTPDLSRCATFYAFDQLAHELTARVPDAVVYFPVPRAGKSWLVPPVASERVIPVGVEHWRDRFKEYSILREEWVDLFAAWGMFWDWDVLVTVRAGLVPLMRMQSDRNRRFVVIFDPLPLVAGKKSIRATIDECPEFEMQTVLGYASADAGVVNARHERGALLDAARRHLAPSAAAALAEKLHARFMVPTGLDPAAGLAPTRAGLHPRLCVFPQRLDATERRPELVFQIFTLAKAMGGAGRFACWTNSSEGLMEAYRQEYPWVEFARPPRAEFYERLRTAHVFVSWATEEGMPLGLVEATTLGVLGIVCRERWSEAVFGRDYPFLCRGTDEAAEKLCWALTDYESASALWREWYAREWIPFLQSDGCFVDWFLETVAGWERRQRTMMRAEPNDLAARLHETGALTGRHLVVAEALEQLGKTGALRSIHKTLDGRRTMWDVPWARTASLTRVRAELRLRYGWRDTADVGVLVTP